MQPRAAAFLDDRCQNVGEFVQPCAASTRDALAEDPMDALDVLIEFLEFGGRQPRRSPAGAQISSRSFTFRR